MGRRASTPIAVALAVLLGSVPAARAADGTRPDEPASSWYGWETLLSDAGAIGLWSFAAVLDEAKYASPSHDAYQRGSDALVVGGFAVYGLGAPAIHALRGRPDAAGKSLALRLGLPVAGMAAGLLVGVASCGNGGDDEVPCPVIPAALGFIAGGVTAMILDAAVIARAPGLSLGGIKVHTAFVPKPDGGTFVLGGRF
jgi:hypothetical protein